MLDLDADLLGALPTEQACHARQLLVARVIEAPTGSWQPPAPPGDPLFVGLLVLEGLIGRDVTLADVG